MTDTRDNVIAAVHAGFPGSDPAKVLDILIAGKRTDTIYDT